MSLNLRMLSKNRIIAQLTDLREILNLRPGDRGLYTPLPAFGTSKPPYPGSVYPCNTSRRCHWVPINEKKTLSQLRSPVTRVRYMSPIQPARNDHKK